MSSSLSGMSSLVGTTWGPGRKSRKRRQLKAEKLLLNPKMSCSLSALGTSKSEGDDDGMEEDCDDSCGGDNGKCIVPGSLGS